MKKINQMNKKSKLHGLFLFTLASTVYVSTSQAQDMRQVSEPRMPAVCTVLTATQVYAEGLPQLDTAKIQTALNACPAGQAVQLAANNEKDSFHSGPLQIPSGVGLIVDRDATLYASTDANLYDKGEKTCGVNADRKSVV